MNRLTTPRAATLIAALIATPALRATAAPDDPAIAAEVARLNEAAKTAVARGDYASALTAYRSAAQRMRRDPGTTADRATALHLAALCLERLNRIDDALPLHREALALGPPPALVDRVRARITALEATLAHAAATGTSPAEAALAQLNETGKEAVARQDYETALSAYRDAAQRLRSFPDRRADLALAEFLAGRCLEALGRHDEAITTYRRAKTFGPPQLQARVDERLAQLDPPRTPRRPQTTPSPSPSPTPTPNPTPAASSTPSPTPSPTNPTPTPRVANPTPTPNATNPNPSPANPTPIAAPTPTPAPDAIPITLDCTPATLTITVQGALPARPCDAITTLPPGRWRLEGRLSAPTEDRAVVRTIEVRAPGPQRFSLVLPPPLAPPPPAAEYRRAWGLSLGAALGLGVGAALIALEGDDTLGDPAAEVGTGLMVIGGLLGAAAIWAFVDPPHHAPTHLSTGVVGFDPLPRP